MSEGASPLWSDEQRGWLQALGHTLYVQGEADAVAEAEAEAAPVVASQHGTPTASVPPAATPSASAAMPARPPKAPMHDAAPTPASAPRAAFSRRAPVHMPDRLQIALLRASGCNPNLPETRQLIEGWPVAELRGNAEAKRRLWPQLRALRRAATLGRH